MSRQGGFVGGALVTNSAQTLFERTSYDSKSRYTVRLDSEIPICSVTKLMTAQLIYGLSRQKKLGLDDSVGCILPWLPDFAKSVTIRQLLIHTSGLRNMSEEAGLAPDGIARIYFETDSQFKDRKALILSLIGNKLVHGAGSNYDYNNIDFLILASVAETVTKQSFQLSLKTTIWDPAGMKHTRLVDWAERPGRYVASYSLVDGKLVAETRFNLAIYSGAGNVISTPRDVTRWVRWLLNQPLKDSILGVRSQFGGFQGFGGYAYDKEILSAIEPVVERPGAIANYTWQISILPNRKVGTITFSNQGGAKLGSVFEGSGLTYDLLKATSNE